MEQILGLVRVKPVEPEVGAVGKRGSPVICVLGTKLYHVFYSLGREAMP